MVSMCADKMKMEQILAAKDSRLKSLELKVQHQVNFIFSFTELLD
jgi:hypothetical protein